MIKAKPFFIRVERECVCATLGSRLELSIHMEPSNAYIFGSMVVVDLGHRLFFRSFFLQESHTILVATYFSVLTSN